MSTSSSVHVAHFKTPVCLYMSAKRVWKEGQLSRLIHCWVPGEDVYVTLLGARLTVVPLNQVQPGNMTQVNSQKTWWYTESGCLQNTLQSISLLDWGVLVLIFLRALWKAGNNGGSVICDHHREGCYFCLKFLPFTFFYRLSLMCRDKPCVQES